MPRTITIKTEGPPTELHINAKRAEVLSLNTNPTTNKMIFTVSNTAEGSPLVEIPTETGVVLITPLLVAALVEDKNYYYNLWDSTTEGEILQLSFGKFKTAGTIEPTFVGSPSQLLAGVTAVVILSRVEYDALLPPDPNTLYFIM